MNEFIKPHHEPDLEVEVSLFPTSEGGRKHPLWQGCRLPHDFGNPDGFNDGMYQFLGEPPSPGSSQKAILWLLAPEMNSGRFNIGFEYKIWDGRFIGRGKITRIINPILRAVTEP